MIPFVLAAVGGYLIGQSRKDEQFADGGMMARGGISKVKNYAGEYFSIREFVETNKGMDKILAEKYKIPLKDVDDYLDGQLDSDTEVIKKLISGQGYRVTYRDSDELIIVKKMADGGEMAKGGTIESDLESFDIYNLDDFEYMQYNDFIKNLSKKDALLVLINNVEGDYSQLSPKLRAIARKHKLDSGGYMARGGIADNNKMYNFLKDDLSKLEIAIKEKDQDEIDKFFSYWNIHIKSLEPKSGSQRMYNFLKEDLVGLEDAIKDLPHSEDEIGRFFSYWNIHLKSLEHKGDGGMADGGMTRKGGKAFEVNGKKFYFHKDGLVYDDKHRLYGGKYNDIDEAYLSVKRNESLNDGTSRMADGGIMARGGKTKEQEGVDLFEDYDEIPKKVEIILDKYSDDFEEGNYKGLKKALQELKKLGYTFEYGLDGVAYDLRKIGQKGKSEMGDVKMAIGGVLEHGLRKGDRVVTEKYNYAGVLNEETGESAIVDIETGERKSI